MTPQQLVAEGVMSLEEAAKFLDCSLKTLQRLRRSGEIHSTYVGDKPKIPVVAAREYLTRRLRGGDIRPEYIRRNQPLLVRGRKAQ